MSLWVKRTGQLLMAALFLMACEDENSLLGFKNPVKKFNVNFIDIPLESSVLLIDSVRTDNQQQGGTLRLLVGRYNDPVFGEVSATTFVQIRPDRTDTIPPTAVYDSLVLELQLDLYAYGASGETQESFSVHEITEDLTGSTAPFKPYYHYNSLTYGPSMGTATYTLNYDSIKKQAGLSTPTKTFIARVKLDKNTSFSNRIFNLIKNNPDTAFKDPNKFKKEIKGLALVPENPSSSVVGFNLLSNSQTKLTLHYHTPNDTLKRVFYLDGASFINIQTNRIDELAGKSTYQTIEPASGLRYLQNGTPVITRVDLGSYYNFASGITNTIFNSAEIVIESVETPGVYTPAQSLYLRTIREDNLFFNAKRTTDKDLMAKYWLLSDSEFYVARNDFLGTGQPITLNYNEGKYSANITLFLQDTFTKKELDPKLRYLALYSTTINKTVNRAVFHKDNVKIRLYYTVPTNQ